MVDHDCHNGGESLPPPHNEAPPGDQVSETTAGYTFVGGVQMPADAGTFAIVMGALTGMCASITMLVVTATMLVVMGAHGLRFLSNGLLRHLAQRARVISIPQMIVELAVIAMVGVMFLRYLNIIDDAVKTLADTNLQMLELMLRRIM